MLNTMMPLHKEPHPHLQHNILQDVQMNSYGVVDQSYHWCNRWSGVHLLNPY